MAPNDRHQIVILTSAFHGFLVKKKISFPLLQMVGFNAIGPAAGNAAVNPQLVAKLPSAYLPKGSYEVTVPYVPEPIEARQLMLSPLGGWLKSRGHWDPPFAAPPPDLPSPDDIFDDIFDNIGDIVVPGLPRPPRPRARIANPVERIGFHDLILPDFMIKQGSGQLDLSEWVHIATQGRDHYAVSYTHLDVYKRQDPGGASREWRRCRRECRPPLLRCAARPRDTPRAPGRSWLPSRPR